MNSNYGFWENFSVNNKKKIAKIPEDVGLKKTKEFKLQTFYFYFHVCILNDTSWRISSFKVR